MKKVRTYLLLIFITMNIMLTVIPIVIVYLLGQKHIIKGVAAGAVKG